MFRSSLILLGLLAVCHPSKSAPIKVSTGEFAPYSGIGLDKKGIATQIVVGAFESAQQRHELELEFLPWKRALEYTKAGRSDASYPYFKNPEREQEYYFSDALYTSIGQVYGNKSTQNDEEPRPYTLVCIPLGYALGSVNEIVNKYKLTLVRPNYLIQCFQLLYKERVEYVFANKAVAEYLVQEKLVPKPDKLYPLPFFKTLASHHLITAKSEKNKQIIKSFNRGLAKFKQTEQYKELTSKVN